MTTPSRALTNDYNDCRLIMLDANDPRSPLVLVQEGYAPSDPSFRMRMFYLQHDGFWIDEIAHSTLPDTEAGDIVFETSEEALQALSGLFGKPLIRDLPVTEADVQGFVALVKGGSSEDVLRQFLARHRAAKGQVCPESQRRSNLTNPQEVMQNEGLNIKEVMESRRHAVEESLNTISVADLKALTDELFPYADHPWLEKFSKVVNDSASGTFHHAVVDDCVHVLYCHDKTIGMWFIRGSGMGPLQPEQLMIMKEIVEARP
jgi:hypothetical protein